MKIEPLHFRETHRFSGKLWMASGILCMLCGLFGKSMAALVVYIISIMAAAIISILYSLLRREMQIWQSFEKLFDKTFRQSWKISAVFGAKKQETFSDFLSWYAAVTGGGYSVVIPRKQTCSPYLKRFLCKWACGCPALFFSAGCKSHLQRLTGSFHFPCSKRLQIFVSV